MLTCHCCTFSPSLSSFPSVDLRVDARRIVGKHPCDRYLFRGRTFSLCHVWRHRVRLLRGNSLLVSEMFGKMYNKSRAMVAWVLRPSGSTSSISRSDHGYLGMPRRYYHYLPQFQNLHLVATVGSWILVLGYHHVREPVHGTSEPYEAPANPWGGVTLEWTIPSPPTLENFDEIPP